MIHIGTNNEKVFIEISSQPIIYILRWYRHQEIFLNSIFIIKYTDNNNNKRIILIDFCLYTNAYNQNTNGMVF